ncbi:MAG: hypothetical protein HQK75_19170, partial [Candidatus Magnetomorum sp.]|nr:hypothetical protein [Candidatus Magnetomorum sp.]
MTQQNLKDSLKTYELVKHVDGEDTPQVMATVSIHLDELETLAFQPAPEIKDEPIDSEAFTELQKRYGILMSSLPVGVLIIDENFVVGPEYTEVCEEILGQSELEGKNLFDVLTLTDDREKEKSAISTYLQSFIQTLGEPGTQNPQEILDIIPPALETDDSEDITQKDARQIRIHYQMISQSADGSAQLMVIIEDITPVKNVTEQVERTEKKVLQLEAIAADPELYAELVGEVIQCVNTAMDKLSGLSETPDDPEIIANLSLNIRKAAGLSSSFSEERVFASSQHLLDSVQQLIDGEPQEGWLESLHNQLNELSENLSHLTEYFQNLTGIAIQETADKKLKVLGEKLTLLSEKIKQADMGAENKSALVDQVKELKAVSVYDGLSRTERMIRGIIDVTGENAAFSIEESDVFLDYALAQKLNEPLIHLFMHILQHNIDSPDARFDRNKVEEANISVSIYEDEDGLVVEMTDDGEGLDPEIVKQTIVEKGIMTQEAVDEISDDECLELIFQPGFYDTASSTQGGMHLDQIQALIRDVLGGELFVYAESAVCSF